MMRDRTVRTGSRRALLACLCIATLALASLSAVAFGKTALGEQSTDILSRDSVLRDPDIPSLGNPKGDLTIVEFFDYQCPYCKKTVPELAQLAKEDGNIRLVLKDWPVFGPVSVAAAKLVLASKYQDKYAEAHAALIGADTKLTEFEHPGDPSQGRCRRGEGYGRPANASKDHRRSAGAQQRPGGSFWF